MISFHGNESIKQKYLARLAAHAAADEIIQGIGWENGKGCAVGCTLHAYNHQLYESELGIPQWLARLEDTIFEGLENSVAKSFPKKFLAAIPVGVNLEPVKQKFLAVILTEIRQTVQGLVLDDRLKNQVLNVIKQCKNVNTARLKKNAFVADNVYAAAYAVADDIYAAAVRAVVYDIYVAASAAVRAAAYTAIDDTYAAVRAAVFAVAHATYIYNADAARAAQQKTYAKYADALLQILADAK